MVWNPCADTIIIKTINKMVKGIQKIVQPSLQDVLETFGLAPPSELSLLLRTNKHK